MFTGQFVKLVIGRGGAAASPAAILDPLKFCDGEGSLGHLLFPRFQYTTGSSPNNRQIFHLTVSSHRLLLFPSPTMAPSAKNPNILSRHKAAAKARKSKSQQTRVESLSSGSKSRIAKQDARRGARPGLLPTSGPNKAMSRKKARKVERALGHALRRQEEAEAREDAEDADEEVDDDAEDNVEMQDAAATTKTSKKGKKSTKGKAAGEVMDVDEQIS